MTDLDALLALAAEAERLIAKECHSLVDSPALCSAVRELAAEVRRMEETLDSVATCLSATLHLAKSKEPRAIPDTPAPGSTGEARE